MQNGPKWVQIVGPIVGAILLLWIVNAMVGQFSADREELAHEFEIELLEGGSENGEAITGTETLTETAATTDTSTTTGTAAVEASETVTEAEPEMGVEAVVEDAQGASVTEGNDAVDIDLDSPAIPSGDPITGTETLTETESVTSTEPVTESTE